MSDPTQLTPAETQAVSPEHEACPELQVVMYPCTFPTCKSGYLDVDLLYVPAMTWINREVGRRRPVTDWLSQATEAEMAEFARCRHHAVESVVGQDYNRRHGITKMHPFRDVLRFAQHKLEEAEFEREQKAEALRAKHRREKEERRERRLAAKAGRVPAVRLTQERTKKYGDEHARVAAEPASNKKKGKKKDDGKKKGGR